MADIVITCSTCGNVITISEFVSAEFITCMKCKTKVPVPAKITAPEEAGQPRLKVAAIEEPEPPPPPPPPPKSRWSRKRVAPTATSKVQQYLPKGGKRTRARGVSTFKVMVLPWLVFIVATLVLGWLRLAPPEMVTQYVSQDTIITAGVWALIFFHISVICYAFSDDSFHGLLCIIIPGYSAYYLFFQSDQMILKAVAAPLLIAFGWDAAVAAQKLWSEIYINVSSWLATTDTVTVKKH